MGQTTQNNEKEKMESNIIVNVVQNEMWLALSIIVVAFMFLCFCGIIFCVFTKYKYDKMKYDENTTSIQSHSSMNEETGHSKIQMQCMCNNEELTECYPKKQSQCTMSSKSKL